MSKLRIQALAKAQNLNMSQLQIQAGVSMGTVRRYWYGTKNGKEVGEQLTEVDLTILDKIARVLGVQTSDLIDEDWLALHLATPQEGPRGGGLHSDRALAATSAQSLCSWPLRGAGTGRVYRESPDLSLVYSARPCAC